MRPREVARSSPSTTPLVGRSSEAGLIWPIQPLTLAHMYVVLALMLTGATTAVGLGLFYREFIRAGGLA